MIILVLALIIIFAYALSFIIKGNFSEGGNKKLAWFVVLVIIPITFVLYLISKRNRITK
jgi:hypothetical protein